MKPPAAADGRHGHHPSHPVAQTAGTAAAVRRRVTELLQAAGVALDGITAADAPWSPQKRKAPISRTVPARARIRSFSTSVRQTRAK